MRRFWEEMSARSLGAVLGIYVLLSLIILAVISSLADTLGLPDSVPLVALVLLSIGLPITLSTAFVQQVTSREGAADDDPARASAARDAAAIRRVFTWRNALVGGVGGFGALAIGTLAWILGGGGPAISGVAAPTSAPPSARATSSAAEGAADAFRALADAIRSMDVEATLAAYDDSPDFAYTFDSELIEGREAFDAQVRTGFAALRRIDVWEIDELMATPLDDEHVVVVARVHEVATDIDGNPINVAGVHTNVFVLRDGAWRIASGHAASRVTAPPEP